MFLRNTYRKTPSPLDLVLSLEHKVHAIILLITHWRIKREYVLVQYYLSPHPHSRLSAAAFCAHPNCRFYFVGFQQLELEERAETAEARQREAESLAESTKGQLEGLGTYDRRTASMLEKAEEELQHLRVQVKIGETGVALSLPSLRRVRSLKNK